MGFPIATTQPGFTCFAFPDVCNTPSASGTVPIPYPNIGQLSEATGVSNDESRGKVEVGGYHVILKEDSEIPQTTGNEAGSAGGVRSGVTRGKVTFTEGSNSVKIYRKPVVRMFDPTQQNVGTSDGNAVGQVLGGVPNVLVGG